jgi:hypothetical protein
MYTKIPEARIETYPDHWRKDHYRIELETELGYSIKDVEEALEELGYEITDSDQWGWSYQKKGTPVENAELDELGGGNPHVKLVLVGHGLEEAQIEPSKTELYALFERIYQACLNHSQQYSDDFPGNCIYCYQQEDTHPYFYNYEEEFSL